MQGSFRTSQGLAKGKVSHWPQWVESSHVSTQLLASFLRSPYSMLTVSVSGAPGPQGFWGAPELTNRKGEPHLIIIKKGCPMLGVQLKGSTKPC